jgi:Leucyl aminopeptidase (aminopeptidase T)
MDDRVHQHASLLIDWSARIDAGDNVVINVAEGAHDLAVAVADVLGERGANLVTTYNSAEISRAYSRAHDTDFESAPAHEHALYDNADSVLILAGDRNTTATADVSGETKQAAAQANAQLREARMSTDWVSTVHPTRALAQQAGMAYEQYQNFVYDAILRDWETLADEMDRLKQYLDAGSELRIVSDDSNTDITMSIENRTAVNSAASVAYDSHNLPSGEVFTAPVETAVSGTVQFDVPMTIQDTRIRDAVLTFEDGTVIDYDATAGVDTLGNILNTDPGARRLGEVGIGMNRGIDQITNKILFDEKMGDTVHLAVGRAYDACLPQMSLEMTQPFTLI